MAGIIIRQDQAETLDYEGRVNRIIDYLRERHPKEIAGISQLQLRRAVEDRMGRAARYGMDEEAPIAAFVVLTFQVGERFDSHPKINAALNDPDIPPNIRISTLRRRITPRDWKESREISERATR